MAPAEAGGSPLARVMEVIERLLPHVPLKSHDSIVETAVMAAAGGELDLRAATAVLEDAPETAAALTSRSLMALYILRRGPAGDATARAALAETAMHLAWLPLGSTQTEPALVARVLGEGCGAIAEAGRVDLLGALALAAAERAVALPRADAKVKEGKKGRARGQNAHVPDSPATAAPGDAPAGLALGPVDARVPLDPAILASVLPLPYQSLLVVTAAAATALPRAVAALGPGAADVALGSLRALRGPLVALLTSGSRAARAAAGRALVAPLLSAHATLDDGRGQRAWMLASGCDMAGREGPDRAVGLALVKEAVGKGDGREGGATADEQGGKEGVAAGEQSGGAAAPSPPGALAGDESSPGPLLAAACGPSGQLPAMLLACLADADPLVRRNAAGIAKEAGLPDRGKAAAYHRLLGTLEELSIHLVEEVWTEAVDRAHPSVGEDEGRVPFEWMRVVWERGLWHPTLQVRKLVAISFFSRSWTDSAIGEVPAEFVSDVLLPATSTPVMRRGEYRAELEAAPAAWVAAALEAAARSEDEAAAALEAAAGGEGEASDRRGGPGPSADRRARTLLARILTRLRGAGVSHTLAEAAWPCALLCARAVERAAETRRGSGPRPPGWTPLLATPGRTAEDLFAALAAATDPGIGSNVGPLGVRCLGSALRVAACLARAEAVERGPARLEELSPALLPLLGRVPAGLLQPGDGPLASEAGELGRALGDRGILKGVAAGGGVDPAGASRTPPNPRVAEQAAEGRACLALLAPTRACARALLDLPLASALGPAGVGEGGAPPSPEAALARPPAVVLWTALLNAACPTDTHKRAAEGGHLLEEAGERVARAAEGLEALLDESCRELLLAAAPGPAAPAPPASGDKPDLAPASLDLAAASARLVAAAATLAATSGDASSAARLVPACASRAAALLRAAAAGSGPAGPGDPARRARLAAAGAASFLLLAAARAARASRADPLLAPLPDLGRAGKLVACALEAARMAAAEGERDAPPAGARAGRSPPMGERRRLVLASWRAASTALEVADRILGEDVAGGSCSRPGWALWAAWRRGPAAGAGAVAVGGEGRDDDRGLLSLAAAQAEILSLAATAAEGADEHALWPICAATRFSLPGALLSAVERGGGDPAAAAEALRGPLHSLGAAFRGARRRRVGLTASLVAAALNPAAFGAFGEYDGLGGVVGAGGPAHGLASELLEAGATSSRTAALMSLQLAGLWAAVPESSLGAGDLVTALALFGVESDPTAAAAGLGDDPADAEEAGALSALEPPLDAGLARAHAHSALAPRVALLCALESWVADAAGDGPRPAAARAAALAAFDRLLNLATHDEELAATRYRAGSPQHRRKVRLWQALAVLCPTAVARDPAAVAEAMLARLAAQDASSVKQYVEICAALAVRAMPDGVRRLVLPRLRDASTGRRDELASLLLLAGQAALFDPEAGARDSTAASDLASEVSLTILPWTTCHVHLVRTFAQLALWRLLELFPSVSASSPALAALATYFDGNAEAGKLRSCLGGAADLDARRLADRATVRGVLAASTAAPGSSGDPAPLEGAPETAVEAIAAFMADQRVVLREKHRGRKEDLARHEHVKSLAGRPGRRDPGTGGAGGAGGAGGMGDPHVADRPEASESPTAPATDRQRKYTADAAAAADAWSQVLGTAALARADTCTWDEEEWLRPGTPLAPAPGPALPLDPATHPLLSSTALSSGAPPSSRRQDLVVVASLIDKTPNLAGLARTCEVFRARALVVSDLAVTADPAFAGISVTAERWLPMRQVPEHELPFWLEARRREGWHLVGLEQTEASVPMPDFAWPDRTILVLGRERDGIPPRILRLLETSVEIPQLGLVRSLNVHVSGALAIYDYTAKAMAGSAPRDA